MSDTIITGAYDMHIHTGPDIMERKMDFLVQAERAAKAGICHQKPLFYQLIMGKGGKRKIPGMPNLRKYCFKQLGGWNEPLCC